LPLEDRKQHYRKARPTTPGDPPGI
jgi:hypothetical protein